MLDEYQIKMLAIQYKLLGFTNKEIAETLNRAGYVTPHKKRQFKESTIQLLTSGVKDQRGKRNAWSKGNNHG
jgi:hypothetical protein|tara:strand:+ start:1663 stop:1878 length:216 start_codon:yes stop_codon:yes gene_type:complete